MFNVNYYKELLLKKNIEKLQEDISKENEVNIANFLEELEINSSLIIFRILPKDLAAKVFSEISLERQKDMVSLITDEELSEVMDDMRLDDTVDLVESIEEEMPASVVKRVLENSSPERRDIINKFLLYPKESAGSLMTIEYIRLRADMTVEESFEKIRRTGLNKETIYTCYVTDDKRQLLGYVSVRTLLISNKEELIGNIMDSKCIYTETHEDREDVAHIFSKYGFLSLPVVDKEKRLVGIITVDDMIDAIHEEATEDFEKMSAMSPSEKPYLKLSTFELAKNRIGWLMLLMFGGMLTGAILEKYEVAIAAIPLLVSFVPMLTDTGGNAGSQSSTLIIRGIALKEIEISDVFQILWKEFRVGLITGSALAVVNYIRIVIQYPDSHMIGLTVSLALLFIVILSKTVGAILPILAGFLKMDPAIMAGPLITTVVDAVGLLVYFALANYFLGDQLVALVSMF